jgi:hypothetical protein
MFNSCFFLCKLRVFSVFFGNFWVEILTDFWGWFNWFYSFDIVGNLPGFVTLLQSKLIGKPHFTHSFYLTSFLLNQYLCFYLITTPQYMEIYLIYQYFSFNRFGFFFSAYLRTVLLIEFMCAESVDFLCKPEAEMCK